MPFDVGKMTARNREASVLIKLRELEQFPPQSRRTHVRMVCADNAVPSTFRQSSRRRVRHASAERGWRGDPAEGNRRPTWAYAPADCVSPTRVVAGGEVRTQSSHPCPAALLQPGHAESSKHKEFGADYFAQHLLLPVDPLLHWLRTTFMAAGALPVHAVAREVASKWLVPLWLAIRHLTEIKNSTGVLYAHR